MIDIKIPTRKLYKHEFLQQVKKYDCKNIDDVVNLIFDDDNYDCPDMIIKYRWPDPISSTILNRINALWVYPLFIIIIPFRYVLFGNYKVDEDSKLYKILIALLGEVH